MQTQSGTVPSRRAVSPLLIAFLAGACLLLLIPAVWGGRMLKAFRPGSAQEGFPDAEIVYNAGEAGLGFVNADGSNLTTLPFLLRYTDFAGTWQSPFLLDDGRTILVTHTAMPGYPGKIFAIRAGEGAVDCGWYGTVSLKTDGLGILVNTGETIQSYMPGDCGTGAPPSMEYSGASGALSPDGQYAVQARQEAAAGSQPTIICRALPTGEERRIGAGNFPAWSRDGQWIAYTGADGIYILPVTTAGEPRRLVALESSQPGQTPVYQVDRGAQYYPPAASWSPDGDWLVYHVYSGSPVAPKAGAWAQYYSIFKVNVQTGKTVRLLDGGYSPSWRWHWHDSDCECGK